MNVYIHFRNVPNNQDAKDYIHHRLSFSLSRFEHVIDNVSVTFSDVNGPRGGIDQQCVMVIQLHGLPNIVITEAQATQESVINRCISRAKMTLARQVKRRQRVEQNNARTKRSLIRSNIYQVESDNNTEVIIDDSFDSYAAQS